MKLLTKYRYEVEDLRWRGYRSVKIGLTKGHYNVILYKEGSEDVNRVLIPGGFAFGDALKRMKAGKCAYFHREKGKPDEEDAYFFLYKGYVYEAAIELTPEEAEVIIDNEPRVQKPKDLLRKQADQIIAQAKAKGSSRAPIPDDIQIFVWKRDGGICVKCGSNEKLEYDHIIPVLKGGNNTARNLQLLCETCNREKGAKIGG